MRFKNTVQFQTLGLKRDNAHLKRDNAHLNHGNAHVKRCNAHSKRHNVLAKHIYGSLKALLVLVTLLCYWDMVVEGESKIIKKNNT